MREYGSVKTCILAYFMQCNTLALQAPGQNLSAKINLT